MSVQKEEGPKTSNTNNGLSWAAAIGVGVGVGAALYYYFSQGENPDTQGSSTQCHSEQSFFMNSMDSNESDDYVTTTDTSVHLTESENDVTNEEITDSHEESNIHEESDIREESDDHEESDVHEESDIREESDDHEESNIHEESDVREESDDHEVSNVSDESASDSSSVTEDEHEMSEIEIDSDSDFSEPHAYVMPEWNIWGPDVHLIGVEELLDFTNGILVDGEDVPSADYVSRSPYNTFMNIISPRRADTEETNTTVSQAFRQREWTLEECSICFDVILKDQEVMSLPCTHQFHNTCILPWLEQRQTCPNCRKAV